VDLASGQVLARQFFGPSGEAGGGIWNSPALSPDGSPLALTTGEDFRGQVGAYDRSMLTLDPLSLNIWQANQQGRTGGDLDFASSPTIFHDRDNRLLVAAGHKDDNFFAYELGNLDRGQIWSRPARYAIGVLPAYDPVVRPGGVLYLTERTGTVAAVDPATGADLWTTSVGRPHGNLALANGLIFADGGGVGLAILDAGDGRLLRTIVPEHAGRGYTGVAVAHGFIYWVSGGYLNAWSLP